MEELEYSSLLRRLIEKATELDGGPNHKLTAEGFIAAVVCYVRDVSDPDSQRLKNMLKLKLPTAISDPNNIATDFILHATSKATPESRRIDESYIEGCLKKARCIAASEGSGEVHAYQLLKCILDEPNDFIRNYIVFDDLFETEQTVPGTQALEDAYTRILGNDTAEAQKSSHSGECKKETRKEAQKSIADIIKRTKQIQEYLSERVFGQDNAVSVFVEGYFRAELSSLTDKSSNRPRATFLFAGPPGVGKTFLAEKAAEAISYAEGKEIPFVRFDMSEYCDKESSLEFIGSDGVYKGSKSGNFTSFVKKNPRCLILLDEVEKAHISIIHLFLQILDAGRIRDSKTDEEVSLASAIMVFTTNAGKQLYENSESIDFSVLPRKVILKALQKDVEPNTKTPYFPAAICSRFASGNVIMFNHIRAHELWKIANREVLRSAESFTNETGIGISVDEKAYTALLLAEGGAADARAVTSQARTFLNNEIYEMLRLLSSDRSKTDIGKLEDISIEVNLPADNDDVNCLFNNTETQNVLIVSTLDIIANCREQSSSVDFLGADDTESAKSIVHNNELSFAIVDLSLGERGDSELLNQEDIESTGRDILWYLRENLPNLPIYVLEKNSQTLSKEEKRSLLKQGIRGILQIGDNAAAFDRSIEDICVRVHQQKSMNMLARANKLISFETSQKVSEDGKHAVITLFDFETETAIEAEDSSNIMSTVSRPNIRFEHVIGAEDAKKELKYFVEYLKNPGKFIGTGVSAPKGVILYGPPGTGKTMLAKAMASESNATFLFAEGNQFLSRYADGGSEKVHEFFRTARKYAPSILFIDEIDAIAKERRGEDQTGAEATLTAFLTEMDGFNKDLSKPVFVLAATNFDVESGGSKSLDPALMRRFDRRVLIDLPNKAERRTYLEMKINKNNVFNVSDSKLENIVVRSTGMSLAALESVAELALRMAIRDGEMKVADEIFEKAFETFNSGESQKWDSATIERVARHEAGHAFLCWHGGETPSYVTVVARANHGGYMQHGDNEEKTIYTKRELIGRIRTSLGGRAAEMVYYGSEDGISTGAAGDLETATSLAKRLICSYGMVEEFGLAAVDPNSVSGELSNEIRKSINNILDIELKKAIRIISENREAVDKLIEKLLKDDYAAGDEIDAIFASCIKG